MALLKDIVSTAYGYLPKGLSGNEAVEIANLVMEDRYGGYGRRPAPNAKERATFVRLSELLANYFTGPGAREWKRATGIDVTPKTGQVSYPQGFMAAGKISELRAAISAESKRMRSIYKVKHSGGEVIVRIVVAKPSAAALKKVPRTSTGQWKIYADAYGRTLSWIFTKKALAARALENLPRQGMTRVSIQGDAQGSVAFRHMWDQPGPRYR